jgi:hypothetical protein
MIVDAYCSTTENVKVRIHNSECKEAWVDFISSPAGYSISINDLGIFKTTFLRKPLPSVWEKSQLVLSPDLFTRRHAMPKDQAVNIATISSYEPAALLGFQVEIWILGYFVITGMRNRLTYDGHLMPGKEYKFQNITGLSFWGLFCDIRMMGVTIYVREVGYFQCTILERVTDKFNTLDISNAASVGVFETELVRGKLVGCSSQCLTTITINDKPYAPHVVLPGMAGVITDPSPPPTLKEIQCEWESIPKGNLFQKYLQSFARSKALYKSLIDNFHCMIFHALRRQIFQVNIVFHHHYSKKIQRQIFIKVLPIKY